MFLSFRLCNRTQKLLELRYRPHKLRHTLATRLYSETKNQALIANQLGHTDLNTSAIYISIVDDENRKGLDQL